MSVPTTKHPAVLFMGDLVVLARQRRLVQEAHQRGYAALAVVSTDTDLARLAALRADPGHPLSHLADVVQVANAQIVTVLPAVQPLLRCYDVRGVISVGEVFVEPVGVLADCLGLPGTGTAAALICRNKLLQRTTVPEFSPPFQVVAAADRASFTIPAEQFPVVVKPAGRFYSSGVQRVTEQAGLTEALGALRMDEIALVEARVVGPEFSVEALVQDGKSIWSAVTGKASNEGSTNYFTETSHTCPAEVGEQETTALISANSQILERIGIQNAITHAEYRLTGNGVVLMEVAARLPGDAIMFLWELATGKPLEPVMLDLALGVQTSHPAPRRRARQHFVEHSHGILRDVSADGIPVFWPSRDDRWPDFVPLAADDPASAPAVLVGRLPGDLLGVQIDSGHRSASVIVDAPLGEDLELATKRFTERVTLLVTPPGPYESQTENRNGD